ncbi:MAG: hypothetical protein OEX12_14650 [Gammaproteobacteria bacterium]|nr:hypothetical protein [Gammaproteobacteria bacterium]
MRRAISAALLAAICLLPLTSQAADKENYLGLGAGYVATDFADSVGYAFMFQMQQTDTTAIGFAYHEGDIITLTYKMYTGKYASSVFWEGGVFLDTYNDGVYPVLAAGTDVRVNDTTRLSLTVGTAFGDGGTAFVARGALMFQF